MVSRIPSRGWSLESLLDEEHWGVSQGPFLFGQRKSPHPPHSSSLSSPDLPLQKMNIKKTTVNGIFISFPRPEGTFQSYHGRRNETIWGKNWGKYCHGFYKKHHHKNLFLLCDVWWQNPLCGNDVVLLGGYFMLLLPCPEIARELWQKLRSNGV